ncbi:hypothetical protein [Henriciella sp.]|nr:hypothetical protein [Henriciella sp.]
MTQRDSFQSWWRDVPSREKAGLKMLMGLFLAVMTLASVAVLALYVFQP